MDRTLILVKPDAFARGLTGEIIARFERKGLRIVALKHMTLTGAVASRPARSSAARRRRTTRRLRDPITTSSGRTDPWTGPSSWSSRTRSRAA